VERGEGYPEFKREDVPPATRRVCFDCGTTQCPTAKCSTMSSSTPTSSSNAPKVTASPPRRHPVDPGARKRSHGPQLQRTLLRQRLLATHRGLPTQVCHLSPRRRRNLLLLRVQGPGPHRRQPPPGPPIAREHPLKVAPRTRGVHFPNQA
jgi:hypothetical protein